MGFLSPLFLIGAAAAAIPIVLHLLKRHPEERVRFAAVRMLESAPVEHSSRRRLRELLLLALRVTALVLLAVAFARPFFTGGAARADAGPTIVVVDTSLSVSAPGTFDRVRQLARSAIDDAPAGSDVGVVMFADAANVAVQPTGDRSTAQQAVETAEPGFGGTNYRAALTAAADLLGGGPGQIALVSDLQAAGWTADAVGSAVLHETATLRVLDAGAAGQNLAVTAVRRIGSQVLATVRYATPETGDAAPQRSVRVVLAVDGKPAGDRTVVIGRNAQAEVTFDARPGESAEVTVDDPEGIAGDNARHLLIGASRQPPVLLVTRNGNLDRDAYFVHRAIAAGGGNRPVFEAEAVAAAELERWEATQVEGYAAVVLLSTRGLDRRGRELLTSYVAGGGGLLVSAGPEVDADVVTALVRGLVMFSDPDTPATSGVGRASEGTRRLVPVDPRHPVFRAFSGGAAALGSVGIDRMLPIATSTCTTLATFTTGERALLECGPEMDEGLGRGRVLVFASDLGRQWNDFPLHAAFVPFVQETLAYVADTPATRREYLVGEVPPGVAPRPGIAKLADGSGPERLVAVNVEPSESDAARLAADDFQRAIVRQNAEGDSSPVALPLSRREERQRLWQYALAAVLALLAAEALVGARAA